MASIQPFPIDWEDVIEYAKGLLLKRALDFVMAALAGIPYVGWIVANPLTRSVISWIITWLIGRLDFLEDLLKKDRFASFRDAVSVVKQARAMKAYPDHIDTYERHAESCFRNACFR